MDKITKKLSLPYPVPPLSAQELKLVAKINATWSQQKALDTLRSTLQAAVEVELATIPIYLYTYYSIQRTVGASAKPPVFPHTALSRFADKAGAFIMSVAVEEMLHMSLSSNILFALGQMPVLFGKSPTFPANLPGHSPHGPSGGRAAIDLAPFSEAHLRQFLLIEYPATADAQPEGTDWDTIGQIYSYARCIISSQWISDGDFQGNRKYQIQSGNYSPNSIDTIYPDADFNKATPVPADQPGSASKVAKYASREDSHVGSKQLLQISSREEALQAIATIDFEGEGFGPTKFDDPSHGEYSHYWKFLTVQSHLAGYSKTGPDIAPLPLPPEPVMPAITANELHSVVFNFPKNPTTTLPVPQHNTGYTDPFDRDIVDLSSALYTYMLIMTETLFKVPDPQQKLFFNQTLHMSMIWLLDKYCQAMRTITMNSTAAPSSDPDGKMRLAPSFQNFPFSSRALAHGEMASLGMAIETKYGKDPRYGAVGWLVTMISGNATTPPVLPDVAKYWMP